MDSRNIKKIVVMGLFVAVLCLSVAYAAISASLKISGTADISASSWDVHFVKNEEVTIPKGKAVCDIGNVEKLSITNLSAVLKVPGDSCTYTVPVENTGSLPASLTKVINSDLELSFKGSGDNKEQDENLLKQYVKYEVNYGGTEINDSTDFSSIYTLEQNEKETVTLRISFSIDAPDIPKEAVEITDLGTEFVFENKAENNGQEVESRYSIKYKGFSGAGYKTRIESGETFTQKIGNVDILYVKMGDNFLEKDNGYSFNDGVITIRNVTGDIVIASENYVPTYSDKSGANTPVLSENMIPVVYNGDLKIWEKQDLDKSYDYSKQIWANAVTVTNDTRGTYQNAKVGTEVKMEDILQMFVWIPRYSYTIKSEDGTHYYGKASYGNNKPTQALPGEIDVKFISANQNDSSGSAQYTGDTAEGWYTPPGFTFGDKNLSGIWIGKFEPSSMNSCTPTYNSVGDECDNETFTAQIKPNARSWCGIRVSTLEVVSMSMTKEQNIYGFDQSTFDSHAAKNTEWALISYLTQSKYGKYGNSLYSGVNKEVYMNNDSTYTTGCSSGETNPESRSEVCIFQYDDMTSRGAGTGYGGAGASTTGNVYGIYDTNGGSWEYTMGTLQKRSGRDKLSNSGYTGLLYDDTTFTGKEWPLEKYYDVYTTTDYNVACNNGPCKGHALNEVAGWYGNSSNPMTNERTWFLRGASSTESYVGGVFAYFGVYGLSHWDDTFRIVLTPNI